LLFAILNLTKFPNQMKNSLLISVLCLWAVWTYGQTSYNKISRVQADQLPFDASMAPFYHGVASGDPLSDRVIIWTRITPIGNETSISGTYFIGKDTSFSTIVKKAGFNTNADKDFTVKIDVTGLEAGTTYYYYFSALGKNSLVGKTKTTPSSVTGISNLKFAVASCQNYEGGFFNAYSRIAERKDLDAVIFLGDYIYEYAPGKYSSTITGRNNLPAAEIVEIADYRTRYSLYRLDKNLQKAHQQHPFITIWDDHEVANDTYKDGAENHNFTTQGVFATRRANALKVYYEWMPIRDYANYQIYRNISYGTLADLIMLDTRDEARDKQPDNYDDEEPAGGRKMMSTVQGTWFKDKIKNSTAKWKLVGNQVLIGIYNVGFFASNLTTNSANLSSFTIAGAIVIDANTTTGVYTLAGPTDIKSVRANENNFKDDWRSYPTQRKEIIDHIANNSINGVVFLSGDSHCSWAFDVVNKPVYYPLTAAGCVPLASPDYVFNSTVGSYIGSKAVEFGTPGISSQNFDEYLGLSTSYGAQYQINNPVAGLGGANYNPHLKYVDLIQSGYFILDVKSDAVQADFYYSKIVTTSTSESFGKAIASTFNSNRITSVTTLSSGLKSTLDIPAPANPRTYVASLLGVNTYSNDNSDLLLLSVYPNPAQENVYVQLGLNINSNLKVVLYDLMGRKVKEILTATYFNAGIYNLNFSLDDVNKGNYLLVFQLNGNRVSRKLVVK
jgi:alkaline phosphatase D